METNGDPLLNLPTRYHFGAWRNNKQAPKSLFGGRTIDLVQEELAAE